MACITGWRAVGLAGFFTPVVLALFFPKLCIGCERTLVMGERYVCLHCLEGNPTPDLASLTDNEVAQKLWGRLPLNGAVSLWLFQAGSDAQQLIHRLKYENRPAACVHMGKLLGRRIREMCADTVLWEAVAYVPMHPAKERRRGYNQARLMAEGVGEVLGLSVVHAISKVQETVSQTRLGRAARWHNVRAAFGRAKKATPVAGMRILLVDDVLTTGATLEGAAQPLLQAGVKEVGIAVLASVV